MFYRAIIGIKVRTSVLSYDNKVLRVTRSYSTLICFMEATCVNVMQEGCGRVATSGLAASGDTFTLRFKVCLRNRVNN